MSTIRVVNLQHTDATEPNIVLLADGTSVFASGITISGGTNLTVSGTAEFASGTVSAPGITFIDDNNTGLYSPATDTVAITTAATERLRIDSAGQVGIGTSSPARTLHVRKDGAYALKVGGESAAAYYLELGQPTASASPGINYTGTNASLRFLNHGSDVARFDSSGRLLLGLSSELTAVPAGESDAPGLQISKTNKPTSIALYRNDTSISSGNTLGGIHWYGDDTTSNTPIVLASLQTQADGNHAAGDNPTRITFSTTSDGASSSTERLRIDSSGRLLVGTSSANDSVAQSNLIIESNSSGDASYGGLMLRRGSTSIGGGTSLGRMFFADQSGNVGAQISSHGDSIWATNDYPGRLVFSTTADGASSPTERMRIDSSGNVLIGHTTFGLATPLSIAVTAIANIGDNAGAASTGLMRIHDKGTTSNRFCGLEIRNKNNGDVRIMNVDSGSTNYAGMAFVIDNGSNPVEAMRIDSSGNVGIGTTSINSQEKLLVHGGDNSIYVPIARSDSRWITIHSGGTDPAIFTNNGSDIRFGHGTNRDGFQDERMRIDSSGNVGIGVAPTTHRLHIHKASSSNSFIHVTNSTTGTGAGDGALIGLDSDESLLIAQKESNFTAFHTSNAERMRITSSGRVLIAKSATNFANAGIELRENGEVVVTRSGGDVITTRRLVSEGTHFSLRNISGTSVGTIVTTSSSTAYNTSSDYRLKENIVDIADGITRVKQLAPRRFNFIADDTTTVDGFIAHEAQTVVPEAVTGEKDGEEMQGIDQSKLVPLLTAALQEAIAKIETLEQRLSDAGIA